MTWWPFVSRERFDDQRADLNRLRDELAFEREQREKLWNWINWRIGGGVAYDTTKLPEAYQPKTVAAHPAASGDGPKAVPQGPRSGKQARRELALFEVKQQERLEELQGHSRRLVHCRSYKGFYRWSWRL